MIIPTKLITDCWRCAILQLSWGPHLTHTHSAAVCPWHPLEILNLDIHYNYEKSDFLNGFLEWSVYLWCALSLPPHLPTQSSFLELFEKKLWKDDGIRKVGIQDLTIQSWNCRCLNRKLWEEKDMGKVQKSRNPRSSIQSSFSQVLC